MYLRAFIAIALAETIQERIGKLIHILEKYRADVKWVKHENLHLTLKFLGDTSEILLPKIQDSLGASVSSFPPFSFLSCPPGRHESW